LIEYRVDVYLHKLARYASSQINAAEAVVSSESMAAFAFMYTVLIINEKTLVWTTPTVIDEQYCWQKNEITALS